MKRINLYVSFSPFLCCAILLFAACSSIGKNQAPSPILISTQTQVTSTIAPTSIAIIPSTATSYRSAPDDGSLDTACRITIDLFFSYKQGFRIESYRSLFVPSSQYLADSVTPPAEALILLKLMPASEEWEQDFPGTPIPGAILPEQANEYVYYAEFTYHYEPDTTPVFTFPDFMTLYMIADGPNSCKIKSYGKG